MKSAIKVNLSTFVSNRHLALAIAALLGSASASAASFTISNAQTGAQTLGAGETGTITSTGSLIVTSSSNSIVVTGNNATITNLGTLKQNATGSNAARAIRDNTGVTGLVVNNGSATNSTALMQTADSDVIQMNKANSSIVFNNWGTLSSLNASKGGSQAIDFNAMTGSNVLYNYATGVIQAQDADAVRPGLNGYIYNYGIIKSTKTTDTGSDGIDLQKEANNATIFNYTGGSVVGARHGITGGPTSNTAFKTTLTNNGSITGSDGSGINLDGFSALQTATITNTGSIIGNGLTGDGDGIDVDGVVNITNSGLIRSTNAFAASGVAQSEGITVGGGIIINSGTIEGLVAGGNNNAVGRGITLAGVDTSGSPEHIYANSTITNQAGGLIRGQNDSAIVVAGPASGFTVTINNDAGAIIRGGGTTKAAILTAADNDTINNAGSIDGSSSGKAIDMGAGNNTLNVLGGAVSINGNINGGSGGINTLTINPGSGNTFAYSGSISNFSKVEVQSGTVTLSGVSNYTGTTLLSGGTLVLNGTNLLSASSALDLHGGALQLTNAGGIDAQTFASLSLSDSSLLELSFASLTFNGLGTVASNKALTVLGFYATSSASYAFRLLGDYSHNDNFLTLIGETTIDGIAAAFHFDGTYTNVAAVPLPPALMLLLSGMGGLGVFFRKRRDAALI